MLSFNASIKREIDTCYARQSRDPGIAELRKIRVVVWKRLWSSVPCVSPLKLLCSQTDAQTAYMLSEEDPFMVVQVPRRPPRATVRQELAPSLWPFPALAGGGEPGAPEGEGESLALEGAVVLIVGDGPYRGEPAQGGID